MSLEKEAKWNDEVEAAIAQLLVSVVTCFFSCFSFCFLFCFASPLGFVVVGGGVADIEIEFTHSNISGPRPPDNCHKLWVYHEVSFGS